MVALPHVVGALATHVHLSAAPRHEPVGAGAWQWKPESQLCLPSHVQNGGLPDVDAAKVTRTAPNAMPGVTAFRCAGGRSTLSRA